jgi:hypothetical protein
MNNILDDINSLINEKITLKKIENAGLDAVNDTIDTVSSPVKITNNIRKGQFKAAGKNTKHYAPKLALLAVPGGMAINAAIDANKDKKKKKSKR